jgi:hypothetical protein
VDLEEYAAVWLADQPGLLRLMPVNRGEEPEEHA